MAELVTASDCYVLMIGRSRVRASLGQLSSLIFLFFKIQEFQVTNYNAVCTMYVKRFVQPVHPFNF